jgi:asparagine synthase (glutamine-hydrolysing)
MCGIFGILYGPSIDPKHVKVSNEKGTASMFARGPDHQDHWYSDGIALGHRRLSIQDLDSRSNQPFESRDQRYVMVYNGEIYNVNELRENLVSSGMDLRTTSDTEVLIELFALHGSKCLPMLRGMFAFAVWDRKSDELFIARDPYGIKPLYYYEDEESFLLSSQAKAILHSGWVAKSVEPAGLAGFLLWGSVPEPWTFYEGIKSFPAGHFAVVKNSPLESISPIPWLKIESLWPDHYKENLSSDAEVEELVHEKVLDSVRHHMVSDVPVGLFLSGGIDSGTIAGLAALGNTQLEGLTISFDEFDGDQNDETPVASEIASYYGLGHHIRKVTKKEFDNDLESILSSMDQPSVDGVNSWFASKGLAELGYKVVLSGVGGDELFCGYSNFSQLPQWYKNLRLISSLGCSVTNLLAKLSFLGGPKKAWHLPRYGSSIEDLYFLSRCLFLPEEVKSIIGKEVAEEGFQKLANFPYGEDSGVLNDHVGSIGILESTIYMKNQLLRDSDWTSMAHSLELRTPLVDIELLKALGPHVFNFGGGRGKRMLSRCPPKSIPRKIVERKKTGFSTPLNKWIKDRMDYANLIPSNVDCSAWARKWAILVAKKFQD